MRKACDSRSATWTSFDSAISTEIPSVFKFANASPWGALQGRGHGISGGGDLKAKKHGRRTIILPDDLRLWLKTLPDAHKPIEESPA